MCSLVPDTRHPLYRPDMIRVVLDTEDQAREKQVTRDLYDTQGHLVNAITAANVEHHSPDAPGMWLDHWLTDVKETLGPELCACKEYGEAIAEMVEFVRARNIDEEGKHVYVWVNCCGVIRGNLTGVRKGVFRNKRGAGSATVDSEMPDFEMPESSVPQAVSDALIGGDEEMDGDMEI